MKFSDQFRTGWRNLSRQKLRTSLTIFAIVIGAVSVTVMISLVTSAQGFMVSSYEKTGEIKRIIVTGTPDQDYSSAQWNWPDGSGTRIDESVLKKVAAVPNVESATLYMQVQSFEYMVVEGQELPTKEIGFYAYTPNGTVQHVMVAGEQLSEATNGKGIVIGSRIASELGFKGREAELVGKKAQFRFRTDMAPPEAMRENISATIVGVSSTRTDGIDMDLEWGRDVSRFTWKENGPNGAVETRVEDWIERNGYASIFVNVDKRENVKAVQQAIVDLKFNGSVVAGEEEVDAQSQAFAIIGYVLGGIGAIALFVAAIGVINTMVMATLERTREIGIMRAIGATKKTVRRLFTVEAGVLGFMGGVFGVALSFVVAMGLNQPLNKQLEENNIVDRNVVVISPQIAIVVIAVTTLIGMLAGRLPARRAANLDPVDALRYE